MNCKTFLKIFLITVITYCPYTYAINPLDILTLSSKPPTSSVSVAIWDLTNNKSTYTYNAHQFMLPASTQKLFIASSSLNKLGPDFHYTTTIETNGKIVNGTLRGNLYIRFDADPSLTTKELYALLEQVKVSGIKKITGNVLLSAPLKKPARAKGWVWDDLGICYSAPISGFILDKNCVSAELVPIKGNKSKVHTFQEVPLIISSNVYYDPKRLQPDCQMDLHKVAINHYSIDGCHHATRKVALEIAIPDPQQFAIDYVAQSLSKLGIRVTGRITENKIHIISDNIHFGKVLAHHKSEQLPQLLTEMLLNSDNMIADTLTKKLGQLEYSSTGSFINGTKAIKKIMNSLGVNIDDATLADGSGLSRYNLVSAHQLLETLKAIHYNKKINYLENALPIAGERGTLLNKHAFTHAPLKGIITAKTGSMGGVSCLAGYVNIPGKNKYAFVIMENGISHKQSKKTAFEAVFLKGFIQEIKSSKH